jgi:hypothetical protein
MGLSLGIGVVGGLSYSMLDSSNVISSNAEIGHLVMLMAITYLISVILKVKKYK